MSGDRQLIMRLLEDLPAQEFEKVIDFAQFLNRRLVQQENKDIVQASLSSTDFWDNEVDDAVWNNV